MSGWPPKTKLAISEQSGKHDSPLLITLPNRHTSRKLHMLRQRPIVSGLLYGIVVFLFMNMIVLPLSAIRRSPLARLAFNIVSANAVLALMLFIGLPIALAVNRYAIESNTAI